MYSRPEARNIRRKLEILSEEKNLERSRVILSTKKEVLGTPTKVLKSVAKDLWHSLHLKAPLYFEVIKELWHGSHEEQMVVSYSLLYAIKQEQQAVEFILNNLSLTIGDWAVADNLGKVLGEYLIRQNFREIPQEFLVILEKGDELQKRMILSSFTVLLKNKNDSLIVNQILEIVESFLPFEKYSPVILKGFHRIFKIINETNPAKSYAILYLWVERKKLFQLVI